MCEKLVLQAVRNKEYVQNQALLKNSLLGKLFTYMGKYLSSFFTRSWNLLSLGPGKQFYSPFVFYCPYLSIFLWLCCVSFKRKQLCISSSIMFSQLQKQQYSLKNLIHVLRYQSLGSFKFIRRPYLPLFAILKSTLRCSSLLLF